MFSTRPAAVACACAFALSACSQSAPPTGATAPAQVDSGTAAAQAQSACDRRLVTAQDTAAVLDAPVSETRNVPGDAQSCEFRTAGFASLTVTLRPGHGIAAVGAYTSGKMNEFDKSEPIAGVGDEAVRSLSLNRIVARKGDLLCEITGPGLARPPGDPKTQKLGAMCNAIFAKY